LTTVIHLLGYSFSVTFSIRRQASEIISLMAVVFAVSSRRAWRLKLDFERIIL
jgi:hypothetical protein